jgi:hypothetical protein
MHMGAELNFRLLTYYIATSRTFNSTHGSTRDRNKHFEIVKKFRTKISHLRLDILCADIKFRKKTDFFYSLCKKKKMSHKQCNTNFCLFDTWHKKCQFSMEQLLRHIEYQDICIKFSVQFFWQFKNVFITKFENQKHMLPGAKTSPGITA